MTRLRFPIVLLAVLALLGCVQPAPIVVDPIVPVPTPVDPVTPPVPVPPGVATFAASELVKVGMAMAEARSILAVAPAWDTVQDDGTSIAEYATVGSDGAALYLDVHYLGATVIGRSRIPRAE